jgi:hypothetical protein
MNDVFIRFSRLRGRENAVLTKQYRLDDKGNICKVSAPNFTDGTAETICINKLSEIEGVIADLGSNECIALGIFDSSPCQIVTAGMLDENSLKAGTRSRTKQHMRQPPLGLALLDHDFSPYMPAHLRCETPDELMAILQNAVPELGTVTYSGTGSCSKGITITATNESYPAGGLHVYLPVKDIDLEALRQYLEAKLWNAGLGYIGFARNGAMLERCIIDLSVLSPERLIYEGDPILGEELSRRPREWQHREGTALTGDLNLTDDELREHEQRVASAKGKPENSEKSESLSFSYHETRVDALAAHRSISHDEARQLVPRQPVDGSVDGECFLDSNEVIEIQGLTLTISELCERGREFDQVAMPDPIEGSGYGLTTAKFYFNDGQSPCIHSFAHGVRRVYRLGQTDDFTPCDYEVIRLEEPLPATPTSSGNPLVEFSLRGMSGQLEKEFEDQVLLLGLIILMYQSSVIYAAPNTGKTLIILWLLINAIRQGKIDPSNVFYINVDDTPNGLIEKLKFADEYGFHLLAEGYNGFRANDLLNILAELIMNDQVKGVIIILDTLKKFTDLMDKRLSSRFSHAIRQFIMRGGTCISLAHTNKHRNSDGKPVYAGTTDIIDDADCAYLMYEINLDVDAGTKTVLFENIKARGNVARQVAYRYSIAEGRSYREMLDSVEPVDDIEASSLQHAAEIESDAQTLDAITECIREGIITKMRLAITAAKRSSVSKRIALRLIEKYTGSNPEIHRWTYTVGDRGAKKYRLLDSIPAGTDPAP